MAELHRGTLPGSGVQVVIGTATLVAGTVDIEPGLTVVTNVQLALAADPAPAVSALYWTESGGTVTITSGNLSLDVSYVVYGL